MFTEPSTLPVAPPITLRFSFTDPDAFGELLRHDGVEMTRIRPGIEADRLDLLQLPDLMVRSGYQSSTWTCSGAGLAGHFSFVIPVRNKVFTSYNGVPMEGDTLTLYPPGAEHWSVGGQGHYLYIPVPTSAFQEHMRDIHGRHVHLTNGPLLVQPGRAAIKHIDSMVQRMIRLVQGQPRNAPETLLAMQHALLTALVLTLESPIPVSDPRLVTAVGRRAIFDRVRRYVKDRMDKPMYLADLCRAADVTERTLREVFREFVGMTPIPYVAMLRMDRAHRMLVCGDPMTMSVKFAALDCGFWDLGRFSVNYKELFGESPSDTLFARHAVKGRRS